MNIISVLYKASLLPTGPDKACIGSKLHTVHMRT